jgi:hypothetical protein
MLRIVIAGCGFAGGVMALRALQLGFAVTLLEMPHPDIGGVEIIPSRARYLLYELGLGEVFAAIRPGYGMGILRRLGSSTPEFRAGRALNVERLALRRAVIAEAAARGAEIRSLSSLPEPDQSAFAFIDATGRRAAWSRPVVRYGRNRADIFFAPRLTGYDTAAVVGLASGWCYAAADQAGTTIAAIHDGRLPRPQMARAIRGKFGITQPTQLRYLGRRPAFPQSATAPLTGCTIAIGDAAFSHDPIGGRGLSFALGCAFAAGPFCRHGVITRPGGSQRQLTTKILWRPRSAAILPSWREIRGRCCPGPYPLMSPGRQERHALLSLCRRASISLPSH